MLAGGGGSELSHGNFWLGYWGYVGTAIKLAYSQNLNEYCGGCPKT